MIIVDLFKLLDTGLITLSNLIPLFWIYMYVGLETLNIAGSL